MDNEYLKRGYLLPEGCSDLIDVMKLKASAEPAAQGISWSASPLPIASEITVPEQMTVAELAAALNQKPFRIIGDLIQSGVRLLRFLGQRVRGILYHGIHHQRLPYQNAP